MAIDDELEKSSVAAEIREESERTIQDMLVKSGAAFAISRIPFGVGAAIKEMLTQLAMRRAYERMNAMFEEMAHQIQDLGEEKINRDWFQGEEFQTLLFEAFHQLHVTQDKHKIRMLGKALANSGATEFTEESRKELFLQIVRDLTPQHVALLRQLLPHAKAAPEATSTPPEWWRWRQRPEIPGEASNLPIFQALAAHGLVEENLKSIEPQEPSIGSFTSTDQIQRALRNFVKELRKAPVRTFRLSDLGVDFLKFVGSGPEKEQS